MTTTQTTQEIDLTKPGQALNRYALEGIGSCHAYLTLREDWRDHARLVQREIGFHSVRSHGIFHDLVGIASSWNNDHYNFQNLDKIYDFWLSQGLTPYIELSFMPERLASGTNTCFMYRANVTPPKDMARWTGMIRAFVTHLIERYTLSEVLTWYFEVWNEPDIDYFWSGGQQAYFELYAATAQAIKSVHPQLRVGGPATSKNLWIPEFTEYCAREGVPVDFVSTHHYCADVAIEMGKVSDGILWRGQKSMRGDVRRVIDQVNKSAFAGSEIHYTEWNASPIHEDRFGKDSEFTAAFVLQTIKDLDGLVNRYMYWAISDVFEESGPGEAPFSGKYGLVNLHGIKKPVYHAFHYFSKLYDEVLPSGESSYVTRAPAGDLRVLTWNYVEPDAVDFSGGDYEMEEMEKSEAIQIGPLEGRYRVRGWRVDRASGNAYRAWQEMGCPQYLTAEQVAALKTQADPPLFTDHIADCDGALTLSHTLPASGLIFYDIEKVK